MINKYYNDVIEQVYNRVGKTDKNIVMACYNNEFSIHYLENIRRYSHNTDGIYFAWHEYLYDSLPDAYAPFLDVICDMYRKQIDGDFEEFLEDCGVYYLLRPVLKSYYETGICIREETLILNEVNYEQEQMVRAVAAMFKKVAQLQPIVIVINRFHLAAQSTMKLVKLLIEEPSANIGIVLGANDVQFQQEAMANLWKPILEQLESSSLRYHIGSSGLRRMDDIDVDDISMDMTDGLKRVGNMIELLDYALAKRFFQNIEQQIRYENITIQDEEKLEIYLKYAQVSIWCGEMAKALELVDEIRRLHIRGKEHIIKYQCAYLTATCYMYQNKLDLAADFAKKARKEAEVRGTDEEAFKAELLMVQAKMSGWYNIFFCLQDIPIEESLIEKLMKYNYKNHLAHIYIYAYDNGTEAIAKAYRSEAALAYFSKGVELAKEIGNQGLVVAAYTKNVMMAAANGMNEIAILYTVRTYEYARGSGISLDGRTLSAIGYNLSALCHNTEADRYYEKALQLFYRDRLSEEIAEIYYNRGMNRIMLGHYKEAEHDFQFSMKIIEILHLNSLRVCNLSKLYGLLALASILAGERFNCERYLTCCRQFLNYIIAREKEREREKSALIHDYTKCDDDMFLYHFATGLLLMTEYKDDEAFEQMEQAEIFLKRSEGTQFFAYVLFRQKRMDLFQRMGRTELYEKEKASMQQRVELNNQLAANFNADILQRLEQDIAEFGTPVTENQIEQLIKQEGLARDYLTSKRQMDFIAAWQKSIDVVDIDMIEMTKIALRTFQNYFSLDRAVYIWYEDDKPQVLYDNTEIEFDSKVFYTFEQSMIEFPQGFAVSKIRDDFFEHQDIISFFGADNVCSFAAVPFFKNGHLSSLLITYILMKDNWHSSIERYMLNDDDLSIYQLLFRELSYSINRLEASNKVREMNRQLQEAAVTDLLTGIYNRAGMYQEIAQMTEQIPVRGGGIKVGLMFIDLDNFKPYNDTFGHDIGDIILREMAAIFKRSCEGRGFVSRYGGDEFIIILDTDDKDVLEAIVQTIYAEIRRSNGFQRQIENYLGHEIEVDEKYRITCSIGISTASKVKTEEEFNDLIKKADDLLYTVKKMEKGHYAFI